MVSIKRNLGLFFIRSLVFVSFMGLCCAAYAVKCTSSQAPCCKGKKMSCCPHPGYENGKELSYDLSECMETITPIDPDGPIVIDPIYPIVKECTSGQKEYKPSGSCGTSERTCCSDGTWSDWDALCRITTTCPISSKPKTSQTCYGGYQRRSVTCNKSTGKWETGSWGNCDCSDSAFLSVPMPDGSTCCQKKNATSTDPLCLTDQGTVGHKWVSAGTSYNCTGFCPAGTPKAGAVCPDSWAGSYCTTHHSWTNNGELCNQFYCR